MCDAGGPSEGSASDCETGVGGERREVRYTDQEYEDDSSDCEDVLLEVPSLPGTNSHNHSNNNRKKLMVPIRIKALA